MPTGKKKVIKSPTSFYEYPFNNTAHYHVLKRYNFSCYVYLYFIYSLCFYLLICFTLKYFLIKHGILFTNFAHVEFEASFQLFLCCSVFNFDFFLEPKKYI